MISKNKLECTIMGFILGIFSYCIVYSDIKKLSDRWELKCGIITVILIIYYIYVWEKMKFRVISPKFFVLISFIFFHLGNVIVIGLNLAKPKYIENLMLYRYGEKNAFLATIYAEFFILFYVIGLVIFSKKKYQNKNINIDISCSEKKLFTCNVVGKIMLAISILPTLYIDFNRIYAKVNGGYTSTYNIDTNFYGIPLNFFTKFFVPSILLLLSSLRYNSKKFNKIMKITIVYYLFYMIMIGRKGDVIQTITPIICMYFFIRKPKIKLSQILYGYFGIYFVTIVTKTRDLKVDENFVISLKEAILAANPITDLLLEMGGTIKAIIQIMLAVPETGSFMFGKVYLLSPLASILSGLGISEQLVDYVSFNKFLSLPKRGAYINSTVASMGGSAIAEWFWNFGWIGIFLAIFMGLFIIIYENFIIKNIKNPIIFAIGCNFMFSLMRYTRGYFLELFWNTLCQVIFVYIIYKFSEKFLIKSRVINVRGKAL